ncbi:hypothetical protein [Parvicella tangerina]|uniref:hypothetical protein n=1 Tax=Parvicella tangerina TaxID=2829795 RepID=UPI00215BF00E|nr:hypothetical protein [Parvicella tangerina]
MSELFKSFQNGIRAGRTTAPREYLEARGIDLYSIEVGYNSGQFHWRKPEEILKALEALGVLMKSKHGKGKQNEFAYSTIGKEGIVLPLKDEAGQMVNYFALRFKLQTPTIEYLNKKGVYPHYPKESTERLFLFQNEFEAATFQQTTLQGNTDAILALHDGEMTLDIIAALKGLNKDVEIILMGCNSEQLQQQFRDNSLPIPSVIHLPDGESLNEFYLKYAEDGIEALIMSKSSSTKPKDQPVKSEVSVISEDEFLFVGTELTYKIYGDIPANPSQLVMQFQIENDFDADVWRGRLDLMDSNETKEKIYHWTEGKNLNYAHAVEELNFITTELQQFRRNKAQRRGLKPKGNDTKLIGKAKDLLQSENLLDEVNNLIGDAGIVGEEKTRLILFLIASSYKFSSNLHAVIQSNENIMGAELVNKIANLIPAHERYAIDLTTSRSFRYYGNTMIDRKLLVIPDYSGVTSSKAIADLKKLQAKGELKIDAPKKGDNGILYTTHQDVTGHTSSIGACNNSKKYFDNEPKTVLLGLDTTATQMDRLMEYDCRKMAGIVDEVKEVKAMEILQFMIDNLHPLEVVNPFALSLRLPNSIPNARTYSTQLMHFVNIIALFHQHQRDKDEQGRVIVTTADIERGIDLFLDTILVNLDELNTNTRDYFENLKKLALNSPKGKNSTFTALEIREALKVPKPTNTRYLQTLVNHEFIKQEGAKNTGYRYKIVYWSEMESIKNMILQNLAELR